MERKIDYEVGEMTHLHYDDVSDVDAFIASLEKDLTQLPQACSSRTTITVNDALTMGELDRIVRALDPYPALPGKVNVESSEAIKAATFSFDEWISF